MKCFSPQLYCNVKLINSLCCKKIYIKLSLNNFVTFNTGFVVYFNIVKFTCNKERNQAGI